MSTEEDLEFTAEEYREFFGPPRSEPLAPRSSRLPRSARWIGLFVAAAMAFGGAFALIDAVITNPDIREPTDIESAAWQRVEESPYGFLVSDIVIFPIPESRVGAFVSNNPPDGVVTLDLRPWTQERLDELMDHEMGHLVDFALWRPGDVHRNGGLSVEAWAECAAVDAGTRRIDSRDPGGEYHCFEDEFEIYQETLSGITEICSRWGSGECRSASELGIGADGEANG